MPHALMVGNFYNMGYPLVLIHVQPAIFQHQRWNLAINVTQIVQHAHLLLFNVHHADLYQDATTFCNQQLKSAYHNAQQVNFKTTPHSHATHALTVVYHAISMPRIVSHVLKSKPNFIINNQDKINVYKTIVLQSIQRLLILHV